MAEEIKTLEANDTWDIVNLPFGRKPIRCKWVYKIKHNVDGTIERYKVELVAKEYS